MDLKSDNERKALGLLVDGQFTAKEIADDLGMSYSAVLRVQRQLDEAQANGEMQDLVKQAETELECVEGTIVAATGMALLEKSVVASAMAISNRIRALAMSAESAGEIVDLTDAITKLNNSFFKDLRPQVQVQNTTITGEGAQVMYGDLLNDKPKNL